MIPGYHIDENHGFLVQSRIFVQKQTYDLAYIDQRYEKYPKLGLMSHERLELIKDVCGRPASIFDFGYGNGAFLLHCYTDGIQTSGYEVNGWPLPECCMFSNVDPFISYDVATLYDVFEHLTEDEQRTLLSTLVCKNLVISVPWCHIELGREWFAAWRHRRPDEHLSAWNAGSLCSLLRIYNYVPVFVGNPEDNIRKVEGEWWPNILTVIFKRV